METYLIGRRVRGGLALCFILALALLSFFAREDLAGAASRLAERLRGDPLTAAPLFTLLYVLFTVLALPGAALTVAAGGIFGVAAGTAVVSVASTLGAAAAFFLARTIGRDAVRRRLAGNPASDRIERLLARHGALAVALLRLTPVVPFNLLNYALGLTPVPFATYLFWSWLCMLPATFLYVAGGDLALRGAAGEAFPRWAIAALPAVAVLLFLAGRRARALLSGPQIPPVEVSEK